MQPRIFLKLQISYFLMLFYCILKHFITTRNYIKMAITENKAVPHTKRSDQKVNYLVLSNSKSSTWQFNFLHAKLTIVSKI